MGHKHRREDLLAAALAAASEHGLARLTFARVAERLGTSDRVVVYYFPTKDALVTAVLDQLGDLMRDVLGAALTEGARDHLDVVRRAWPVLAQPGSDPVFALYLEACGLAAAGHEPYRTLAAGLVEDWTSWLVATITGAADPVAEARAALAVIDGLALVRQLAGPEVADSAARALGV